MPVPTNESNPPSDAENIATGFVKIAADMRRIATVMLNALRQDTLTRWDALQAVEKLAARRSYLINAWNAGGVPDALADRYGPDVPTAVAGMNTALTALAGTLGPASAGYWPQPNGNGLVDKTGLCDWTGLATEKANLDAALVDVIASISAPA